jgi:hypothetical protein
MENLQHEQYEYARRRIRQKKNVFFHFVLFFVGSIFLYLVNKVIKIDEPDNWYIWVITAWGFLFILHFIKVFITDSFMNKNWERHQIDKLVSMQQKKIQKLQAELNSKESQTNQ